MTLHRLELPAVRTSRCRMAGATDNLLRTLATGIHRMIKRRSGSRPGVHAIALTAERHVVLVKLRYAPGWRLPGGGRDPSESPRDAILRELREEIGMTSHGETRLAPVGADELLIVRDVQYRPPRWSWEIQEVIEAPIDDLPDGVSPLAKRWLTAVRSRI